MVTNLTPVSKRARLWTILGVGLCLALSVRLIPYVAPIRESDVAQHQQAVEFTDRNGLPLGTLLTRDQEHTVAVPLDAVAPDFVHAIIAAEDRRFERHGPVDYLAMARALVQDVRHHYAVSGASTITMQLARMVRPSQSTLAGKIEQVWTAWRIAAGMSRPQILSAYVNRIPMGSNIYGVEAAARTYLGLPASQLDLAQASLLAAIPNDPPGLYPYEHWAVLKQRQRYVLDRMVKDGYIGASQAARAVAEQIPLQPRGEGIVAAPHFLFFLAAQLPEGSARVRTTIDRDLQLFVETQVRQVIGDLASRNVHHAAVLVIDNHTRQVLAYVGSPDYFSEANLGRNDGVQALRQPGSALKPFLYELALETQAIQPNTILADVPAHYAIPGDLLYSPEDYSGAYQGPVRVRIALADSLNIPAVRVLSAVGVPQFLDRLHELGFSHLDRSPDYYGLGLTLGGGEVSLWELTRAYVTLAHQGVAGDLVTVLPPSNEAADASTQRVGDATAWELVTDILADAHARAKAFGVNSVLDMPFPAAVKTGTSSDFRDTWTVGFTTDYTVGVWVGNFNGDPMQHVSGVTGAAPLWNRILLHLHENGDPEAFAPPFGLRLEPICATTGLRPTPACKAVVFEYLYPQDMQAYRAALRVAELSPEYDSWVAAQGRLESQRLRILFPHQGDLFVLREHEPAFASAAQALQFHVGSRTGQHVRLWLNGRPLQTDGVTAWWPLRVGTWTLAAAAGTERDRVTFTVVADSTPALRRGFSLVSR
ncbi:MAG TPA: penicillin-binding protein 1C [Candidatus Acidoferrales bacterium]|nr:penicillin-binding protein 1C [Candidatus Acidoferrales bacterium]